MTSTFRRLAFAALSALVTIPAVAGLIVISGGRGASSSSPSVACSGGSTINAASASEANVASAIASASPGDTVSVPAGSGTWSTLAINKAVCLTGAGIDVTNITIGTGNTITKQASGITYIKGFTFSKSGGGDSSKGIVISGGPSDDPIVIEQVRIVVSGSGFIRGEVSGGVIVANSQIEADWDDSVFQLKALDNSGGKAGDSVSWSTDDTLGDHDTDGKANWYFEDNDFYGGANQSIDADDASRVVFRYNHLNLTSFNSHGLATSEIGCRHFEIYDNTFDYNPADESATIANMNWLIWIRGGTGVIYSNVFADISGGYWGPKSEGKFDVRAQEDNSGSSYGDFNDGRAWLSAGSGTYPRQHQLGVNWSSSVMTNGGYYTDPIYIWGNTGTGASGGGFAGMAIGGEWGSMTGYFTNGTDYVIGTAKPSYTAYTYPHPLRQTVGQAY